VRVLHIIKVTGIAGAEQHLLRLLAGLRARQIDAQVVLLVEPGNMLDDYARLLSERGVPVERLVIHRHVDVSLIWRLWNLLRRLKPEIVHTHLIHADVYGIPAARLAGVPAVVTSRHSDNAFRRRTSIRLVNYLLWRIVDAGIGISDSVTRFSSEVEGAPPGKMCRIYYGLETDSIPLDRGSAQKAIIAELGLPAGSTLIGLVCRLTEQKGVTYAIEAFRRIAGEYPDANLLIAGKGPQQPQLEALAMSLSDRVYFLGWREDVAWLMAAFDIFLMPSLWEGFGLALLEAMAQQTPIIASRVSAIPEIVIDQETGLLVPPRDVDALAAALRQLLQDKPLGYHMGLMGRDRLETYFSLQPMVEQTAALYNRLIHL
jgi:glycosyltransferase involved in cell wall biosynthesis